MQTSVGLNDPNVVFRDVGMKMLDMGHVLLFHGDETFGTRQRCGASMLLNCIAIFQVVYKKH